MPFSIGFLDAEHQELMPIIPATQEAEMGRLKFKDSPYKKLVRSHLNK
jgi:hypothetical protein